MLTTHSYKDEDIDKIVLHLQSGKGELSPALQYKLERMYYCADLIKQYGSRLKVIPMLRSRYSYSRATAYRDFEDTQEVFGTVNKSSRDFYVDIVLGMMFETRAKAYGQKDYKTAAVVEKNIKDTVAEFFGDKEMIDWEKLIRMALRSFIWFDCWLTVISAAEIVASRSFVSQNTARNIP